ncbi:MAG: ABC transporter ATP-binding protein [Clostridiales bacterium]|nr:ABC transporter ATP-binding protein [Clostridiales bacterium]
MITVKDLVFSYTEKPFIETMNFSVRDGEIFGFLGPSGAGKSTLQKLLTGLLPRYGGSVTVDGTEAKRAGKEFYQNIGVDFEFPSLYEKLTGRENLRFFASLYRRHRDIDALLKAIGLHMDADKKVSEYSKGMKSRLNFIKALLHSPKLLFLDEPTNGLDPSNARVMKDMILQEKAEGKTVILTTHNMYDATELCDHVSFIVDGAIAALDTPKALMTKKRAVQLTYTFESPDGGLEERSVPLTQTGGDATLRQLIGDGKLASIHSAEPTLNDVFVEITGRRLQ